MCLLGECARSVSQTFCLKKFSVMESAEPTAEQVKK